jgi:hypothetical protein
VPLRLAEIFVAGKKPKEPIEWGVYLIRKKAQLLGYVEAPDEATAIKTGIKEFEITDPEKQQRVSVQRVQPRRS